MFLGVDGGQSSTTAWIADGEGRVVGTGEGGPCYDLESAIHTSVGAACRAAGIPRTTHFRSACLGLSGGAAGRHGAIAGVIDTDRLVVTDDAVIALTGAVGSEGIIVIAGTGSIAFGRNAEGRIMRAGGWGYIYGDEGGAFDIVREAVRAALRAEEGWGEPTILASMLLQATGCATVNEAMHEFYSPNWPRTRVAALAPQVDSAAAAGDPSALAILSNAGAQLAGYAGPIRERLWPSLQEVNLSYVGGVFASKYLLRNLKEAAARCRVVPPRFPPAGGALIEAFHAAGEAATLKLPV